MGRLPRILMIHEQYGLLGGAERLLLAVSEALSNTFELHIMSAHRSGKGEELFDRTFHTQKSIDFTNPAIESFASIKPDLICVHKCASASLLEMITRYGVPSLRFVHDHEVYCMRRYKYFPISRRICHKKAGPCCLFPCLASVQRDRGNRFGVRWVSYTYQQRLIAADKALTAFIVGSRYMYDELCLQGYDSTRVTILPSVPPPILNTNIGQRRPNQILFVGQVVRGKGLDVLIQSLDLVKTPCKLVVVGEGSYLSKCRQLAKELEHHEVVFEGYTEPDQLASYYAQSAILAFPSVWPEPFGMVGIEAMRYGLPLVGFDSGGVSDWLRNDYNGYLIPWMDVPSMADRIDYLLKQPSERKRLGDNGLQLAHDEYRFELFVERLKKQFLNMLA